MDQRDLQEQLAKVKKEAEERDAQRRADKLGLDYLSLLGLAVEVDALKIITEADARRLKMAPFVAKNHRVDIAALDTEIPGVQDFFRGLEKQGWRLKIFIVSETTLNHIFGFYKYVMAKRPEIVGRIEIEKEFFEKYLVQLTDLKKVEAAIHGFDYQTLPTRKLLEIILAGAIANRSSDIHFEPEREMNTLRFRVDGLLHDVINDLNPKVYEALLSRIKLLAGLKLNVHNEAQDGRFTISHGGQDLELRISVVPAEFGEEAVMRILDPSAVSPKLHELGFRPDDLIIIEEQLKRPNGMLLNTGPTGSGKTTTLYAFLAHKADPELKIITIEDPIEYHLGGIEQTQVDVEAGYDFANGLQAMMRQDPDIILVGEIRDAKTAAIAIQAALTGHLVFSTVHANSAAGAIPRLLDLEIRPASIGPAMNMIIAQRLVRRLCVECKKTAKMDSQLTAKIKKFLEKLPARVDRKEYQNIKMFDAGGCAKCNGLGYKGRTAVLELLVIDNQLEKDINENISEVDIQERALKQGMVTMQQDGILKVISGMTTFEEVERATGALGW